MNYTEVRESCRNCAKQYICNKENCKWVSFIEEEIKKIDRKVEQI